MATGDLQGALMALYAALQGSQEAVNPLSYPTSPASPAAPLMGRSGGLFGLLGGMGGGMGGPFSAGVPGPFPSGSGGFTASPPGKDFGGYDTSPGNLISQRGITGVAPAARRLADIERHFGVNLPVVSDYRSSAEQASLYDDYIRGLRSAPVAPPGQSYHEQGEAFDITASWLAANPEVRRALLRTGFTFDVPGEPWHAHFTGGPRRYAPARVERHKQTTERAAPTPTTSRTPRPPRPRRPKYGLDQRRRYTT